jgi:hypothetical protein
MMIRKNSLVLAAAFTGLLGGTMARLNAAPPQATPTRQFLRAPASSFDEAERGEGEACLRRKKLLQGQGRLQVDNGCKGKNSCKGKGGCATDGSKKK